MHNQKKEQGGYNARQGYAHTIALRRFVAALMLPLGRLLFPYVSHELTGIQFQAIEAVVSATLGFGISSILG